MHPTDYNQIVSTQRDELFDIARQYLTDKEMEFVRAAYELAYKAHAPQSRNDGEPYITHPIAVSRIVCEQLQLGVNSIVAALLHDVVEDTPVTIEDIRSRFGDDVAFLVKAVTKEKKENYEMSKQLDNFWQMLDSIHYDIRALLIKLADRLHNMRTLSGINPAKQMKIASETDYFYAPLANRLGLYDIKSELENLSFRFRSPQEYERLERMIDSYMARHRYQIDQFISPIEEAFAHYGIRATITIKVRSVYALWHKMNEKNLLFRELEHPYILNIIFSNDTQWGFTEKAQALRLYYIVSEIYKERPYSLVNYIDSPKDNGYQSLHCQFMCHHGNWIELHISSETMALNSRLGCIAERSRGVELWVTRFKEVLKEIATHGKEGGFMEDVVSTFYRDDIVVFTPKGAGVVLPKGASALDFAYEIHTSIGNRAKYAHINGKLSPVITKLKRGDRVEIGTDNFIQPSPDWLGHVVTYKAKKVIQNAIRKRNEEELYRTLCPECFPLPGDEIVGFKLLPREIEVHKRNCPKAISLSAKAGDSIEEIKLSVCHTRCYPSVITVIAVNRNGLLFDLVQIISKELGLGITSLHVETEYEIVNCVINLMVPSANELTAGLTRIEKIEGVEEARRG